MKAMIIQPMAGRTDLEISETRDKAKLYLEENGYEVVNTLFSDEWVEKQKMEEKGVSHIPVYFLSKSIEKMSTCDTVYLCKGWETARGCVIEEAVAYSYGLNIIYEKVKEE